MDLEHLRNHHKKGEGKEKAHNVDNKECTKFPKREVEEMYAEYREATTNLRPEEMRMYGKEALSIIGPPIIKLRNHIQQLVVGGIHIIQGGFKKIFDAFKTNIRKLDSKVNMHISLSPQNKYL